MPATGEERRAELARVTEALTILARHGIAPDVLDLLFRGNPMRGTPPGALAVALAALRNHTLDEAAEVAKSHCRIAQSIRALKSPAKE